MGFLRIALTVATVVPLVGVTSSSPHHIALAPSAAPVHTDITADELRVHRFADPIAPAGSAPAPVVHSVSAPRIADRMLSDEGTLRASVGVYRDCSGISPIPVEQASIWTCVPGVLYFVGHNPGVFTPLLHLRVGDRLTYFDHRGVAHHYRIVLLRTWGRSAGFPPPASAAVVAQLQTCVSADAWVDRILDLVEAP